MYTENRSDKDYYQKPILVLGLGNSMRTDDGVGVYAVRELMKIEWPQEVEIAEGGIAGLNLIDFINDRECLIVVDAIEAGQKPGTIFKLTLEDFTDIAGQSSSLHQIGLIETIQMAKLTGNKPKYILILGVQPEKIDWGQALSETVSRCLSRLIALAKEEINSALENYGGLSRL